MPENITHTIEFKSQASGNTTPAQMHITEFSVAEQKSRAIQSLLKFWLIAAVCILIPIAHFLLVPGFFIGGIIVASRRWKTEQEGDDASGNCPACDNHITIPLEKNADLPQWHDCPECADPLQLQTVQLQTEEKTD